jgi:hypothetical protein
MKTKIFILILFLCIPFIKAFSQVAPTEDVTEVYGFAMVDAGYNMNQINPQWYDAMRPSRLPKFTNEFGTDGNTYISARQSRFGIKTAKPTDAGEFKAVFDFDMYGVGVDAGQTTIRLRHAYGQLGHWGGGLTESAFMDGDVFPNTFEYWGPNGMMFLRNVQLRWQPIMGPSDLTFALEAPGASADRGEVGSDPRVDFTGLRPRFQYPDFSGHYRSSHDWGYVQLGGIVRYMAWEDLNASSTTDLSGNVTGWGVSLSTNLKLGQNTTIRAQISEGAGIENYFNDAPIDVATTAYDSTNVKQPVKGEALGDLGAVLFIDHNWNSKWCSSIGGSYVDITNSTGQNYDAYSAGSYAVANLIYMPIPAVMMGIELQYVSRDNYKTSPIDGFTGSTATKVNVSFKYSFGTKIK